MLEEYYKNKLKYREHIIILKYGYFYECLENDALIMNKLFNYKLVKKKNYFQLGFPEKLIESVKEKLKFEKINYIIISKDKIEEEIFPENNYNNYQFNDKELMYYSIRIENIIKYLNDNIINLEISEKIEKIEKIIEE